MRLLTEVVTLRVYNKYRNIQLTEPITFEKVCSVIQSMVFGFCEYVHTGCPTKRLLFFLGLRGVAFKMAIHINYALICILKTNEIQINIRTILMPEIEFFTNFIS